MPRNHRRPFPSAPSVSLARFTAPLLLTLSLAAGPAIGQEQEIAAAPAIGEQVAGLAEEGRFDDLLQVLKDNAPRDADALGGFIGDLQRYREHLDQRTLARRTAFEEAFAQAQAEIDAGKLEDALVKAIEAHDLADDPDLFLSDEQMVGLTQQISDHAAAAMAEENWVDALILYRLLHTLHEETRRYRTPFEDAASHIRVLQLYHPLHLRDLYRERALRIGDEDNPLLLDDEDSQEEDLEDWTVKLDGVTRGQMLATLSQATGRHIDQRPYTDLLIGAIQGLRTVLMTDGLDDVFPGMADAQQVQALLTDLDAKLADLQRPGRRLTRGATTALVESVFEANTNTVGLPEEVVAYELATGATGELDPFSTVIWPEAFRQFQRSISGDFVGVGVQIQRIDGQLLVITPLEGTPGMAAGIKAEDVISRVDGRSTSAWSLDKAVREITGPEGTEVALTLVRPGMDEPIEVTIVRSKIVLESIKGWALHPEGGWDYWVDRDAGIGYIRMSQFLRQTTDDLDRAVAQLREEGDLNGLVIDLRFNPGGLLSTAVQAVDRFIDHGRIVSTVDSAGRTTSSQSARRHNTYPGDLPVAILINQGSASASEILAGALQDYGRAFVIGDNSYGKGSVQDIFPLRGNTAYFKCTTQYYQLPQGRIIHRTPEAEVWGIQPDLPIRMTTTEIADWLDARRDADVIVAAEDIDPDNPRVQPDDILTDGLDPQLEAALLYLQAQRISTSDKAFAQQDE